MTGVVGGTLDLDVTLSAPGDEKRTSLVVCTLFSMADTLAVKSWRREKTLLMTRYIPAVDGAWIPKEPFSSARSALRMVKADVRSCNFSSATYR
jgi:hypothetical protein